MLILLNAKSGRLGTVFSNRFRLNQRRKVMDTKDIATLKLTVDPKALHEIITSGRLLEFANTAAAQAATQISAQLVQQVAEGALRKESLTGGMSVDVTYRSVLVDGEPGFGTHPPGPRHPPKVNLEF
jgi:hypothetical protein